MATKAQQAHALRTYFKKKYKQRVGRDYSGNAYGEKWGFQDMLEDLGDDDARRVIDWYFQTAREIEQFSAPDLHKNYDKLLESLNDYLEDKARLERQMEITRQKVEEYRRNRGLS